MVWMILVMIMMMISNPPIVMLTHLRKKYGQEHFRLIYRASSVYRISQLLTRPSRSISLLGTIAPVRRYIIGDVYVLIVPQRLICWLIMDKQRAIVFACLMYRDINEQLIPQLVSL